MTEHPAIPDARSRSTGTGTGTGTVTVTGTGDGHSSGSEPHPRPALEIAVTSVQGARQAQAGGADRVELCVALELGGLTPSQGLVEEVIAVGLPVHVLVRCRPGDFVFDAEEKRTMDGEIRTLLAAGSAGVVVGALGQDGELDESVLAHWLDSARSDSGAEVTFHRAVDHARDPIRILERLTTLGVDRVLTSGAAPSAREGAPMLRRMIDVSGAVSVMAGGGVRPEHVVDLARLGVDAVHLSAKTWRPAAGSDVAREPVPLGTGSAGSPGGSDAVSRGEGHFVTDPALVRAARSALDGEPSPVTLGSTTRSADKR